MVQLLAQVPPPDFGGGFNILQSLQSAFTTLVDYLPRIVGAIAVLIIGYIIAKILNIVITKLLRRAKLDARLTSTSEDRFVEKVSPDGSPARLVGGVVFWVIMVFVIASAIGTLNIPALTGFMNLVLSYLPNVLAALLIFIVAAAVAGAIGGLAHRTMGDTPTGRVVRTGGPALVMAIAIFMILTQLGIAPVIVTATYIALIGAIALGAALAFGLGGRDAAADMINNSYRKAQEQSDTIRQDAQRAGERGQRDAQRAREHEAQAQPDEQGIPRPTDPSSQQTPRSGPGLGP
jgi:small-conductance mechanosensitive channel